MWQYRVAFQCISLCSIRFRRFGLQELLGTILEWVGQSMQRSKWNSRLRNAVWTKRSVAEHSRFDARNWTDDGSGLPPSQRACKLSLLMIYDCHNPSFREILIYRVQGDRGKVGLIPPFRDQTTANVAAPEGRAWGPAGFLHGPLLRDTWSRSILRGKLNRQKDVDGPRIAQHIYIKFCWYWIRTTVLSKWRKWARWTFLAKLSNSYICREMRSIVRTPPYRTGFCGSRYIT